MLVYLTDFRKFFTFLENMRLFLQRNNNNSAVITLLKVLVWKPVLANLNVKNYILTKLIQHTRRSAREEQNILLSGIKKWSKQKKVT